LKIPKKLKPSKNSNVIIIIISGTTNTVNLKQHSKDNMIYSTMISALAIAGGVLSASAHNAPTASSLSLREIHEAKTNKGTFKPFKLDMMKERATKAAATPNLRTADKARSLKGDKNNYIGYTSFGGDATCNPHNQEEIRGFLINTCMRSSHGGSLVYKINKKQHALAMLEYHNDNCMGVPDSLWDISSEIFPGFNDPQKGLDFGSCFMSPEYGYVTLHYWTDGPVVPMDTMGSQVGVYLESQYEEDCDKMADGKQRRPLSFAYWNDIHRIQDMYGGCHSTPDGGSFTFSDCVDGMVDMMVFPLGNTDCSLPFVEKHGALPHCEADEDGGGDFMHEVTTAKCIPPAGI
jgi:hypothetical protein